MSSGALGLLESPPKVETELSDGSGSSGLPKAHYARKEDILRATVFGDAIRALCGKIWIPTRTGDGLPICQECKRIHEAMP